MGGNNNVIIRIPFLNEFRNIIFKSDLNGSITPGSNLVWNRVPYEIYNWCTWSQNNYVENAYLVDELAASESHNQNNKAKTSYFNSYNYYTYAFRPIIEYRE